MKQNVLILLTALFLLIGLQPAQAVRPTVDKPVSEEIIKAEAEKAKENWENMSRKEKKEMRKEIKATIKDSKAVAADTNTILLAVIAIFIPPLAMLLYDGLSGRFWLSLLLTLLFFIPGLIYTLVIILGNK